MSNDTTSGTRLLIIDASTTGARVMESVLSQAGYDVTCVGCGTEAVCVACRIDPSLIFLDYRTTEIPCAELARTLAEQPELAHVPIILMSTRADAVTDPLLPGTGIVDHIKKPFAPEALVALVEHTLRKHAQPRTEEAGPGATASRPAMEGTPEERSEAPLEPPATHLAASIIQTLAPVVDLGTLAGRAIDAVQAHLDSDAVLGDLRALLRGRFGAPALAGDLGLVPIADVLQMLSLQRQSGVLTASRGDATISIALKDGAVRLVTGENAGREFLLGTILVREKLMASGELSLFLQNRKGTRQRLGTQVVKLGYVSHEDLKRALKRQSSELVYELLRWGSGPFEFYRRAELPEEVLEFDFGITIDELLMEGFRRVDEWHLIEAALPSLSIVPVRTTAGLEHVGPEGLTAEEQEVYDQVDGLRSLQEIIETVGKGTFEVARMLYRLAAARVIEVAGQMPFEPAARRPGQPPPPPVDALDGSEPRLDDFDFGRHFGGEAATTEASTTASAAQQTATQATAAAPSMLDEALADSALEAAAAPAPPDASDGPLRDAVQPEMTSPATGATASKGDDAAAATLVDATLPDVMATTADDATPREGK